MNTMTQDEIVTAVRDALYREIERQTGNDWPVAAGGSLYLIDAELDLNALALAAMSTAQEPALDDDALIERLWDLHRRAVSYASDKPCVNMLLADLGDGLRDAINRLQAKAPETGEG